MTDRIVIGAIAVAIITASTMVAVTTRARAHDAPLGWRYEISCCSSIDCRQVPNSYVQETASGYVLTKTNETIPYGDKKVKDSPDGLLHWCTQGGTDQGKTLCLYVPPRGY